MLNNLSNLLECFLPGLNLARVDLIPGGQLGHRLLAPQHLQSHLGLESRAVLPASLRHFLLLVTATAALSLGAGPSLSHLSEFPGPPHNSLVQQYINIRNKWRDHELDEDQAKSECLRLISAIDAEVLKAYGFSPRQERLLLDWFAGSRRLGPVEFTEYSPQVFRPPIPRHQFTWQGLVVERLHGYLNAALQDLARVVDDAQEEGWTQPTSEAIRTAEELVKVMYDMSPRKYDIYPMEDGEVVIDAGDRGHRIGVFCYPDGRVLYIGWVDGQRQRLRGVRTENIPHDFLRRALSQLDED